MIDLATARLQLRIDPDFGARITGLTDLDTGRDWLVPGPAVPGGTYGAAQAAGWDECFPTVAPCASAPRDHGDLWGVPVNVREGPGMVSARWEVEGWSFTRDLHVDGDTITARYAVTNHADTARPWMWSQHCLIAPQPGDRITLSGIADLASGGRDATWPVWEGRDLSLVPEAGGWAVKLYARAQGSVTAGIANERGGLTFGWQGDEIPALGLWLSHGGWNGTHQIAIEPTTAPADDLDTARHIGAAPPLPPGATKTMTVTLQLTGPQDSPQVTL